MRAHGYTDQHIRWQVRARRWAVRSSTVISIFTGELTWLQRCWLGVLHAGPAALIGGIAAANYHGLKHWQRADIAVLVPDNVVLDPLPGITWVRTRRRLETLRDPRFYLPVAQLEPAILIFGAAQRSSRTALGIVAAAIQQRLTSPAEILAWVKRLRPLKRAPLLRASLADFAGGAESVGERDVAQLCRVYGLVTPKRQGARKDAAGRWRYRDCWWQLPEGRVVVLEVDGAFHMDVNHWQADIARDRNLAHPLHTTVRCTTDELRTHPDNIAAALIRLGVPRSARVTGAEL